MLLASQALRFMQMCQVVSPEASGSARRLGRSALLSVLLLLLGCGGSERSPGSTPEQNRDVMAPPPMASDAGLAAAPPSAADPDAQAQPETDTPTISGIGAVECEEDAECSAMAQDELDALVTPAPSSRVFEGGVCIQLSVSTDTSSASGPACQCNLPSSGWIAIGPSGAGCYVYGRLGDCLFRDEEFSDCELDETTVCTSLCGELQTRYAADAARTFSGEVVYATCDAGHCHDVLEVDEHCYADRSYELGRAYDCALGGRAILAQDQNPPTAQVIEVSSPYIADANGFLDLTVQTSFVGTTGSTPHFGTMAQLYSVTGSAERTADVIDPLAGVDDCGVSREHNVGTAPNVEFLSVDSAVLIDDEREVPYELLSSSNGDFYSYGIDLTDLDVAPRFGGTYGFRAVGGSFGEALSVKGIVLPEPLSIHELELSAHVERGPLHLTWTGHNTAPLRLLMYIYAQPQSEVTYTLECLMQDDGDFEIPDAVMQAVPNGIAQAEFMRDTTRLLHDGDKAILTTARVDVTHEFAYGERCERAAVVASCKDYADKMQQVYGDCGRVAPALDELCPEYLGEACTLCPEYYQCMARTTTCTDNQVTVRLGCSCPKN
jgi:hypothetical protein